MPRYKQMPMPPDQVMLFGTTVEEALPADSDVRAFGDVMECLDYSGIKSRCSALGCPPYPPEVMVKILTYAYSKGLRSSRKIEHQLKVNVEFIWLAGGLKPDHNTLARFRKDNYAELSCLFKDSVRVCAEAGLVYLNVVATDGTKIASAGSARSIYGGKRLERELAAVDKILAEAQDIDTAEDKLSQANDLPEKLRDAKQRKAHLQQIADRLKETNRSTSVATEPDARVMRTSQGTRPAYNLQAAVDAESQVIVAMSLTNDEADFGKLPEMVEQVESNTGLSPDVSLADCGYCDEATIEWLEQTGHQALMPIKESYRNVRRNDLFASKCFIADEDRDVLICPAGRELTFKTTWQGKTTTYRQYAATNCQSCSFYPECVCSGRGSRRINIPVSAPQRKAMKEELSSEEGRQLFQLRSQTVEPVFGQIKSNNGLSRFVAWGFAGASAEAALASIAHNVKKCVASALQAA